MILPARRAIMCGATCFTIRKGPRTLTAMTLSHNAASHSVSARGVSVE